MSDPFEAVPSPFPTPSSTVREPSVQQAETFLNDPRVKNADAAAALDFLRKKGITEEELREAYRRCGLPFPSVPNSSSFPQHPPPHLTTPYPHPPPHLVPYHPPPQRGPSWVSVFLGIAAAAGIYTAFREVLKRYVVPMYFPEAARIAEERRRQDQMTLQAQDMQIAELRRQITELAESSRKTNETVDKLSQSIRSMTEGRSSLQWPSLTAAAEGQARQFSQSSELRNAIRPLSHSVSASGGTDTSRVQTDAGVEQTGDVGYRRLLSGKQADKQGSLSYTYVDQFTGSAGRGSKIEESVETGIPGTRVVVEGDGQRDVEEVGTSYAEKEKDGRDSEDEFMSIKPAEVEESWGAGLLQGGEGRFQGDGGGEGTRDVVEKTSGNELQNTRGDIAIGRDEEERVNSVEVESVTKEDFRMDRGGDGDIDGFGGTVTQAARQLFQTELMNEAKYVFGGVSQTIGGVSDIEGKASRGRPLSMPAMEPPLSDNE